MSKITDIKTVRELLIAAEMDGPNMSHLGLAKQIVDFLWEEHGIMEDWETELLAPAPPEPTPWEVSKFRHDPVILAKFLSKEEAVAYLAEQVGNTPSNTEFAIKHIN